MVLPYPQNAGWILFAASFFCQTTKDGILKRSNANKPILVLHRPILALFMLLLLVERHNARPEAESNELMAATNRQHRHVGTANEVPKVTDKFRLVVIKVAQRAAQNYGVRFELLGCACEF